MFSILNWCGRFGNNVQQISNAIFHSQTRYLLFNSPDNENIKPFRCEFGGAIEQGLYFFHLPSEIGNGDAHFHGDVEELKKCRRKICLDYIFPNLKIDFSKIDPLPEDVAVVHIRGGDVFKKDYCSVVSNYLQNPLDYFQESIGKYRKAIVVAEDNNNPVVSKLSGQKNVQVLYPNVKESIEILISARNLVTSGISSFGMACALLSKNILRLHHSNLKLNEVLNQDEFFDPLVEKILYQIDLDRYIKFGDWRNTPEQRDIILNYR